MSRRDCLSFAYSITIILLSLFEFCLGISEAIFVSKYDQFDDGCRSIWKWILAAACINIIVPVITGCGITTLINTFDEDSENNKNSTLLDLLQIGQFVIGIWSGFTYNNIDSQCHDFWESSAPQLWTFVAIHYISMMISLSIALIAFIIVLFKACGIICCDGCQIFCDSKKVNTNTFDRLA